MNEANEVLSDPEKRKRYDLLGADWEKYAGGGRGTGGGSGTGGTGRPGGTADPFGPGGPFAGYARPGSGAGPGGARYEFRSAPGSDAGFSDFFRTFFGGGMADDGDAAAAGSRAAGRGGPRTRTSTASMDDLLGGLGYQAARAGYPAGAFDADGQDMLGADGRRVAGGRGGSRTVEAPVEISLHEAATGTTRIVQLDEARLEVKIPRGADTGSRVRLRGKGGGGRDLVLVVKVTPHPSFTRQGADLIRELPVTLREALLGAEVLDRDARRPRPPQGARRDAERPDDPPQGQGDAAPAGRRPRRPARQGEGRPPDAPVRRGEGGRRELLRPRRAARPEGVVIGAFTERPAGRPPNQRPGRRPGRRPVRRPGRRYLGSAPKLEWAARRQEPSTQWKTESRGFAVLCGTPLIVSSVVTT